MSTIRVSKDRNYSVINNTVLNDARLSWKAKGLAAYLLSKPDDWNISRDHLAKQSADGVMAVRSALKELEECGYLRRTRRRGEDGKFSWEHTLFETPQEEKPLVKNPLVDFPLVDFPPVDESPVENAPSIVNTDIPNTELLPSEVLALPTPPASSSPKGKAPKPRKSTAYVNEETGISTTDILQEYVTTITALEPRAVIAYEKEAIAARRLAQAGWRPPQVAETVRYLKEDKFYGQNHLSLHTVAAQIAAHHARQTLHPAIVRQAQLSFSVSDLL